VKRDFAMSNELINALESRVTTAVDTIEGLRSENRMLREERQILEAKLKELLQKIDMVDNGGTTTAPIETAADESSEEKFSGFNSPHNSGDGFSQQDY